MRPMSSTLIKRRTGQALGTLFICLCLMAILLSSVLPHKSSAANEISILPVADTFVRSTEPNQNFGSASQIAVDTTPLMTSFLRFQVSGVGQDTVAQARLRLHVYDESPLAGLKVFTTTLDWDEMTVTWNTQPALGAQVAELAPIAMPLGTWIEVDLGQAVLGDGMYSFALTTDTTDRVRFRARTRIEAPQLVLTLRTGISTSTPAPSPTATSVATPLPTATPAVTPDAGSVVAFPGAEGFGAHTPGGRGGRIFEVINLKDRGPGSLRACLQASGPRICIFRTGGTIWGESTFSISNPFVTIAGQTAPGDGITLRGAPLVIKTHDVIVRGLRIRIGDQLLGSLTAPDGIRIESQGPNTVYNVIVDHCSVSWAIDENLSLYKDVRDITYQWNITSEGLAHSSHSEGLHSMGLFIYEHAKRISVHHNLMVHNNRRNPSVKGDTETEIINNVIYNWGEMATHLNDDSNSGPSYSNIIGNYYKPGVDSGSTPGITIKPNIAAGSQVYITGNIDLGRRSDNQDDWAAVSGNPVVRSLTPAIALSGITTQSAFDAYELVLAKAGAIAPTRDAVDQRVVADVRNGQGRIINSQDEVAGFLNLQPGTPPVDTDHDGMPDNWELERGLAPNVNDSAQDRDGDGYTNIEEYINGLIP